MQEQDRIQKAKLLIKRCLNYLEVSDIILLMQDHGLYNDDKDVLDLIEQTKLDIAASAKLARRAAINNNLIAYKVNSLFNGARTRAKVDSIPFNLTKEWIQEKLETNKCEATGLAFVIKEQQDLYEAESNPYAPSIDKIDPSLGYTTENCQMVIIAYNKFKSDYKESEIRLIARSIVEYDMIKHN